MATGTIDFSLVREKSNLFKKNFTIFFNLRSDTVDWLHEYCDDLPEDWTDDQVRYSDGYRLPTQANVLILITDDFQN